MDLGQLTPRTTWLISIFGLVLLIGATGLSYWSAHRYREAQKWSEHSAEVIAHIRTAHIEAVTAESAARGFLMTGNEFFDGQFQDSWKQALNKIYTLKDLVSDNAAQKNIADNIKPLMEARLSYLNTLIDKRKKGGIREVNALIQEGTGMRFMNRLNEAIDRFEENEAQILSRRENAASEEFSQMTWTEILTVLAALTLLFFTTNLLQSQIAERNRVQKQLSESQKRAIEASELKSSFLANMSHEIRTPLNGIVGMTKLLEKTPLNHEQNEFLDTIKVSSNALLALINQILDFSKIESGKMQLEEIPFEMQSLIESAVSVIDYSAKVKGLVVETHIDSDVPEFLLGDSLRLRQVMLNLLNNAVKFSEHGKISITVQKIRSWDSKVSLRFDVVDQGVGLEDATKTKLFQAFTQGDESTSRKHGGTGLGLAISKQIVEMMDGKIGVESELGKGSRFYFEATFKASKFGQDLASSTIEMQEKSLGGKILIAEDNKINQKVIVQMMKLLGCQVHLVNNGFEVIAALNREDFDMVLMDGQMPQMDGYEATRLIREGKVGPSKRRIPIIAITANAIKGDVEKCLQVGMNDYIGKPISYEDLAYKVEKWLKRGSSVIDVKALDRVQALSKDGDENLLKEVIEIFMRDGDDMWNKMQAHLGAKEFSDLSRVAHGLKSSCANLGALRCRDLAERLEKSKIDPNAQHIGMLLESLRSQLDLAFQELKVIIKDYPKAGEKV